MGGGKEEGGGGGGGREEKGIRTKTIEVRQSLLWAMGQLF